jgi:diketogulonate reductase-like aldo/keto reductase
MEYKTLKNGFKLPSLGLGTWLMGGAMEADYLNDAKDIEAIQKALELGYTHIDTAEGYAEGHCEELVGEAIKGFDRSKLIIATKVTKTNLKPDDLRRSLDNSMKRLGVDYVDLYMIHSPSTEIPLSETMPIFDEFIEQRLIKNIGVSNFTVEKLEEAIKYTKNPIVSNQIEYSLMTREEGKYGGNHSMESKTVPFCQKNDIFVVAERPIERGLVTEPHPLLDELSKKYDKTKAQIAINWLLSKDNVVTIPKASNPSHLEENLGGIGWSMEDEDVRRLDFAKFPRAF